MKGIIFNLLEEVVTSNHGEDAWDQLLDSAGIDRTFTSLGSYPDENMQALVMAASRTLDMNPFEVLRWFGRQAMPLLAGRFPGFFSAQSSTRPFLLSVNSIIHPEVRKLYPEANCPTFEFRDAPDGALLMGYRSPRRLCALAQGFTEGAAAYYHETVSFEHRQCMHPLHVLKIDRSFISRMAQDADGLAIVQTIVNLARDLGMEIVAEGTETEAQVTQLGLLGCDFGQGYFFSKPVEAAAISDLLRTSEASRVREYLPLPR